PPGDDPPGRLYEYAPLCEGDGMNGETRGSVRIAVIGLDGCPLSEEARRLVSEASLVAGGERHLAEVGIEGDRALVLRGDLSEAVDRISGAPGPVAVLASGDPGFFGITRLLSERFGPEELAVHPARSSVSLAFARAGLSWEDALVVSAHGREPRRAVNVCRRHPKVAVLTAPDFGPSELAEALDRLDREFFVCERLGAPDERVFRGKPEEISAGEWRDPNVVVVVEPGYVPGEKSWVSGGIGSPGRWALAEDEFEHRSDMISKSEVRAFVLSRLGPGVGDLVWDVGAGSGSVAVECSRLGAAAIAVDRDREACGFVRKSVARHGAPVEVVEGEAPDALEDLPDPDAVFIGGTGGGFEETIRLCAGRSLRAVVLTLVTVERVVPAAKLLEEVGLEVETTLLQASRMKGVGELSRLVPENPVFVVAGRRA
ncbi:MAG: precorrin-6y C5,15-methyltransferase (decarboxylating) subunit CbiE, partial [Rubrobacteraceae bacterium]